MKEKIIEAAFALKNSKYAVAFTGAGISVESGIPPFRGENGLWGKYDPQVLDLDYFYKNPKESWTVIKEIFYDFFGVAKPNNAHLGLAELGRRNILKAIVTQNIDNLHQEAGSEIVYDFHGNSKKLICTKCNHVKKFNIADLEQIPPKCDKCGGLIKPDFVFFGENIPNQAFENSFDAAKNADVLIIVGTTGEVYPASLIPIEAKNNNAKIIEINLEESSYTNKITDIFIQNRAGEVFPEILKEIDKLIIA